MGYLATSRRDFLAAWGAVFLPRMVLSREDTSKTSVFLDESGNAGTDRPFVIGGLFTADPARHIGQLSKLRKQNNYRLTLRYSSTDRYKLPYARDVIEYFFGQGEMRFAAAAFPSSTNIKWPVRAETRDIKYLNVYEHLINQNARKKHPVEITTELRTTTGEDRLMHQSLEEELKREVRVRIVREYQNDLTQFAGLLVGSVYGDLTNSGDEVKLSLIKELRQKLGVPRLYDASLATHNEFRVAVGTI
jgi:hypothetical protein